MRPPVTFRHTNSLSPPLTMYTYLWMWAMVGVCRGFDGHTGNAGFIPTYEATVVLSSLSIFVDIYSHAMETKKTPEISANVGIHLLESWSPSMEVLMATVRLRRRVTLWREDYRSYTTCTEAAHRPINGAAFLNYDTKGDTCKLQVTRGIPTACLQVKIFMSWSLDQRLVNRDEAALRLTWLTKLSKILRSLPSIH